MYLSYKYTARGGYRGNVALCAMATELRHLYALVDPHYPSLAKTCEVIAGNATVNIPGVNILPVQKCTS